MHEPANLDRSHLPQLMELTGQLLEFAQQLQVEVNADNRTELIVAAFVSKQMDHMRSIRLLVREGQHGDSFVIARLMAEGMAQLLWAYNCREERIERWYGYAVVEDWRQLRRNERAGRQKSPDDENTAREFLGKFGPDYYSSKTIKRLSEGKTLPIDPYRRQWHGLDIAAIFTDLENKDLYDTVYRLASDRIHWNPRAMFLSMAWENGFPRAYRLENQPDATRALAMGFQALFQSLEIVDDQFPVAITMRLGRFREAFALIIRHPNDPSTDEPGA